MNQSRYGYIVGPMGGRPVFLAQCDVGQVGKSWHRADGYESVESHRVLYRIDHETRQSTPIAVLAAGADARKVIEDVARKEQRPIPDPLVRLSDLVTQTEMARRWKCSPKSINEWKRHPTFPRNVASFGNAAVWLWPEVNPWYQTYKKGGRSDKDRRREEGVGEEDGRRTPEGESSS